MVKALNWFGWFNPRSGYGVVNLEYATAVARQGVDVSIGWERMEHVAPADFAQLTSEQQSLLYKPYKQEHFGIIKTTPQMFGQNKSEFRIGYTMVENTMVGKKWVEMINNMDAIFVPSAFLIEVFQRCGVTRPIQNVKQGMDSRKFPYFDRAIDKPKYVFGIVSYMDDRKNWQALVQAFCSEFNQNEPVELWIKNSNPYFAHYHFTDPRIKVINRQYTFPEIQEIYRLFDCFVFPSHAEGSGLPPREAMATGLPCIITNWSGMTEVANSDYNYPLTPVAIDHPDVRGEEQPGFMARIDNQELMYYMRYVYEHREEAKQKGKKASKYIHENWSWEVCAQDLLRKLEKWI